MRHLRAAAVVFAALTLLTGFVYPLVVLGIGQLLLPTAANGSLVVRDGAVVGSALIGQQWQSPDLFWGRPSATAAHPYDAALSSGSNLGPRNPALRQAVEQRVAMLRAASPGQEAPVPIDLVTSSGSGLDPDISVAAARWQVPRVAAARGLQPERLAALVDAHARRRWLGLFGEPAVNVLELNLALRELH